MKEMESFKPERTRVCSHGAGRSQLSKPQTPPESQERVLDWPRAPAAGGEEAGTAREGARCVSEAIRKGRGVRKLSHLPLLLGPLSPSEHPGNIGGHGAPSQHDSCGLVPGVSGTRMGTLYSPPRHYCSSAGPAGEPDPRASSESSSDYMGGPSLSPCTIGALHRAQKGGAPWEDSAGNNSHNHQARH